MTTLKQLHEEGDKEFDDKFGTNSISKANEIIKSFIHSEREKAWNVALEWAKEVLAILDTCLEGIPVSDPMMYGNSKFETTDVVERLEEVKKNIFARLSEGMEKETIKQLRMKNCQIIHRI